MSAERTTPEYKSKPKPKMVYGVISDTESYSVDEFRRRIGLGAKAWRELKANGLKVCIAGRRTFVLGTDWHEFLRSGRRVD